MSFVAILIALLLEQARPVGRGNTVHSAMRAWVGWCGRTFDAGKSHHAGLAWGVAVLLPALVVLAVYWLLAGLTDWPLAVHLEYRRAVPLPRLPAVQPPFHRDSRRTRGG